MKKDKVRCGWAGADPLNIEYHDTEWGVPCRDDRKLFEFLVLEGAQAGLSWITILRKREGYREAFDDFDLEKIVRYRSAKIEKLLINPNIVRNRLKVESVVINARRFLEVQNEFGRFADYIWRFVDGKPIQNRWKSMKQLPASSRESDTMSKDLKKRGFKFVGTTICYAYMQAMGLVNDHTVDCFRHRQVQRR
ncbi:MAG TPA: DNA-3-methyladenine glycosylase I [Gammaproteobacteria bacterium]